MGALLRLARVLDRFSLNVGKAVSWVILPLIFLIMFDVITCKIDFIKEWSSEITIQMGYSVSFILQDLQWHVHGILLLLSFGFGYMLNAHVRVDIFREMATRRKQVWIEAFGLAICGIPFLLVMIYFSWIMTSSSFIQGEGSESQVGLGFRFFIKSFLIWGFTVALAAVLATFFRCFVYLFGSGQLRKQAEDDIQFFTDADLLSKLIGEQNAEAEAKAEADAKAGDAGHG